MKEHRKSAAAGKAAKLTALALKRVIPYMRTSPPSSEINTTDEPTGIPPSADKPAFKNGGKVYGSLKAARGDRPAPRRAMGGGVDDGTNKGQDMAKKAAAAATLTGQSNRIGYKAGGAAKADGGEVEGHESLKPMLARKGQGARAGFAGGGAAMYDTSNDDDANKKLESTSQSGNSRPGRADGGRVDSKKAKKGGTTVNVIIAPQGAAAGPGSGPPMVPPGGLALPPPGALPPRPPPPPMAAPAMPPGLPPGGPGPMPPGGVMPMRAAGGRVGGSPSVNYDAGAGGALGRLEKAKKYGTNAKAMNAESK